MDRMLGGFACAARSAQRVGAGEEAADQPVRLIRALDLRHVAAALEDDLLGPRQPLGDVALEPRRDQRVVRAPDEERRALRPINPVRSFSPTASSSLSIASM